MKHLLEMNHFLPTLKTGNAKKSNVQLDEFDIPEDIRKFFTRNNRTLSMISEIHEDGSIDVNGDIRIYSSEIIAAEIPIKFGMIIGSFSCENCGLHTLKNCPYEVTSYFNCRNNHLNSLEYSPNVIGGWFDCSNNELETLADCPETIGKDFWCYGNRLTSLRYCPTEINGDFYCNCNKLKNLDYCPTIVKGDFQCDNNLLTSLENCPREVGGHFYCYNNFEQFTIKEVMKLCNIKGTILVAL